MWEQELKQGWVGRRRVPGRPLSEKKSIEPPAKVKTGWSNSGVSPDTSPRNGHPPLPDPQRSLPGTGVRSLGVPWPAEGGWRVGESTQSSVQASSCRCPQRIPSIILGVSRLPATRPRPLRPRDPSGSFLNPRPRLSEPLRLSRPPGQPAPAALTCEPRPGPSISPVTGATQQSGGCNPLASPPRACRIPLPARGPASTASHALSYNVNRSQEIQSLLSPRLGAGLSCHQGGY